MIEIHTESRMHAYSMQLIRGIKPSHMWLSKNGYYCQAAAANFVQIKHQENMASAAPDIVSLYACFPKIPYSTRLQQCT